MDMEELRTYIELAGCRSFSKTAELVHVAQSTVSKRIQALEDYVGEPLVLRDKTGIRFTRQGELFLEYARRICELESAAVTEVGMLSHFEDRLDIGCVQWIYNYLLMDRISDYSWRFPRFATSLTISHGEDMIPLLQKQSIDVGFSSYEKSSAELESRLLCRSPILLLGESTRFKSYSAGIQKQQLSDLPLIYSDIWQNYLTEISEHLLAEWKLFHVRCNMLDSAKQFCLAGAGVCFLPKLMVEKELQEGKLVVIPVEGLSPRFADTYMVYRRSRAQAPAVKAWLELFDE